jgi:hypothetical protein
MWARGVADRQLQPEAVDVRIVAAAGSTSSLTQQPPLPSGPGVPRGPKDLKGRMQAMLFNGAGSRLALTEIAAPTPSEHQVLIRVSACAVCRTDLHIIDGDLREPKLPLIPGHEIVGVVADAGAGVDRFRRGNRIGVPWLGSPVTRLMAALPNMPWPINATALRCPRSTATWTPLHSSAQV